MSFDRRALVRSAGALGFGLALLGVARPARAETGYDLWLRYAPIENAERRAEYRAAFRSIVIPLRMQNSPVVVELELASRRMLGSSVPFSQTGVDDGALVVGTPATSPLVAGLGWDKALAALGDEGYVIRSARIGGHQATVIASRLRSVS